VGTPGALVGGTALTINTPWTINGNDIYKNNSGNVGIGSTTPGTLLSLGNTGANTINISNTATSTFGYGLNLKNGCYAVNGTCLTSGSGTNYWTNAGGNIYNNTGTNVGIGSTTPWATLSVNPASQAAGVPSFVVGSSTKTDFVITQSGKVIVGAAAPTTSSVVTGALLTISSGGVAGALQVDSTSPRVYYNESDAASDGKLWDTLVNGSMFSVRAVADNNLTAASALDITRSGVSIVSSVFPNGNVGIGTSTPKRSLAIASSTAAQLMLTDASLTSGAWNLRAKNSYLYFATSSPSTFATSSIAALTINPSGFVGVGVNAPAYKLDVGGYVNVSATTGYKQDGSTVLYTSAPKEGTYVGIGAGNAVPTGGDNSAFGYQALYSTTGVTGINNTAIGARSLYTNLGGGSNTALGFESLYLNLSGEDNTAVGMGALYTNSTGSYNTALGKYALNLGTGSSNVALGYQAGANLTTGTNNIIIGNSVDLPSIASSNMLSIGNLIYGTGLSAYNPTSSSAVSTGRIGIGTTTPWGKFSVNPVSQAVGEPSFVVGSSTKTDFIVTQAGNVGVGTAAPGLVSGANKYLTLRADVAAGAPKIAALEIGGTTGSPSTVSSRLSFLNSDNIVGSTAREIARIEGITASVAESASAQTIGGLQFLTADSTNNLSVKMVIRKTGAVGIGTTTPRGILTISTSTAPQITLTDASLTNNAWNLRAKNSYLYFATSSPSTFATSSVPALTISPNGYVGVGTAAPTTSFFVQGNSTLSGTTNFYTKNGTIDVGSGLATSAMTNSPTLTLTSSAGTVGVAAYQALAASPTVTWTGANNDNPFYRLFIDTGTLNLGVTTAGFSALNSFMGAPTVKLTAGITHNGTLIPFLSRPVAQVNDDTSVTFVHMFGFGSRPHVSRGSGATTGTVTVTNLDGYNAFSDIDDLAALGGGAIGAGATVTNLVGARVMNITKNAAATITNFTGVKVEDLTQGGTNIGIDSQVSSGSNKWNIYSSGTASNYFAGKVGIGTVTPAALLHVSAGADQGLTGNVRIANTNWVAAASTAGPSLSFRGCYSSGACLETTFAQIKGIHDTAAGDGNPGGMLYFTTNGFNTADTHSDGGLMTFDAAGLLTTSGGLKATAGGLTVTAGGATITAGGLTVTAGGAGINAGNLVVTSGTVSVGSFDAATDASRFVCADSTGGSILQAGSATSGDCDSSSRTKKHDIVDLAIDGIDALTRLRAVTYVYNNDETGATMWGFVAEELDALSPALAGHNEVGAPRSVQKNAVLALLTKALQEMNTRELTFASTTAMRLDSLEDRLVALESGAISVNSSMGTFSTSMLTTALADLGITVQRGIAQFNTLVSRQFVASRDTDGTSSAASVTINAGNTYVDITNAFVHTSTKILVTFSSQVQGSWWVSEKREGGFRVQLSAPQSGDVSFDYFLVQTDGQLMTPTTATSSPAYAVTQGGGTVETYSVQGTLPEVVPTPAASASTTPSTSGEGAAVVDSATTTTTGSSDAEVVPEEAAAGEDTVIITTTTTTTITTTVDAAPEPAPEPEQAPAADPAPAAEPSLAPAE
ncbi:MAG: tail fiber domain-containing protein, partial [Candidatus Paceibacterota bacterium]